MPWAHVRNLLYKFYVLSMELMNYTNILLSSLLDAETVLADGLVSNGIADVS